MLVWESQCFDLKEIRLAQQAVDVNAQSMCGQLTDQTSTQTPEGMGIVLFNGAGILCRRGEEYTVYLFAVLPHTVIQYIYGQ